MKLWSDVVKIETSHFENMAPSGLRVKDSLPLAYHLHNIFHKREVIPMFTHCQNYFEFAIFYILFYINSNFDFYAVFLVYPKENELIK